MDAGFEIYTLGGVRILRGGEPVVGLTTRKTEALLIYLASTHRPQPREVLANLFWGDRNQSQAMGNLRGALSNLHQVLGETLTISRTEVSFAQEVPIWLDTTQLESCLNAIREQGKLDSVAAGQAASILDLYRGEFLEGFSVYDCPEFEQWAVQERERLHHLVIDGLSELVDFEIEQKEYKPGVAHAARLLSLDPLNESAHRQMMRLFAVSGQRNAALNQYEMCQKLLQEELGVAPEVETLRLYEQIRAGNIEVRESLEMLPSGTVTFLFADIEDSTGLLEQLREQYVNLLAEQAELLRTAFRHWHGHEIGVQGDAFLIAFGRAADAIACAIEAQHCLAEHAWPQRVSVRVRMGLHTGEPLVAYSGYIGMDVHRAAQVAAAGYGGQVLLSQTTRDLVYQELPPGAHLRDLGMHNLRETRFPQQIFQLDIDDLPCDFPALKNIMLDEEPPTPGKPPFKGLQYFEEEDAELFFGRSQVTDRLVEMTSRQRFLAVIGASGSGKSSVLRAGLVPALQRCQPGEWDIYILTPTVQPLESMAVHLTRRMESVVASATLLDDLRRDERSLHLYLRKKQAQEERAGGKERNVLLLVDQFEELFTMCREEPERQSFIDNLIYAAQRPNSRVHVLIALRADFYDHLAEYSGLRQAVAKHQEYLGAMSADELRQAIEEPAKLGGWHFTPGLVELMLHEVGADNDNQLEPGALPLLSHALLETWKHRRGTLMSLKAYGESGGVRKAIAHTAERLYTQELSPAQQQIARNIFLRLTELGEGTQDTRRRASLQELYPQASYSDPQDVEEVLLKLADARLIVTGEGTAEVAHEALIREWPMLHEWLMQDREGLRLQRHLSEAAQEWLLLERDPGALYRGARLAQALEWAKANSHQLNEQEQAFLDASRSLVEQEQAEKEAARQHQLEAAQQLADEQSRSAKRLRKRAIYLSLALAAAMIMIVVAAVFAKRSADNASAASQNLTAAQLASTRAVAQQSTAEAASRFAIAQQSTAESASGIALAEADTRATAEAIANDKAQLASSRELAAASVTNLPVDPQRSLLLAIQAVKTNDNPQTENALHQAIRGSRLRDSISYNDEALFGVKFSPDGRHMATISMDGNIYLFSMDASGAKVDRASVQILPNPMDYDGQRLSTGYTLDFSPDGRWLVSVAEKQSAKIWEVSTGSLLQTLSGHTREVLSVVFSSDGKLIATGSVDATVKIWEAATGKELQTLTGFDSDICVIVFSSDGKQLIAGSAAGQIIAWEIQITSNNLRQFTRTYAVQVEDELIASLAINPAGNRLAAGTCWNLMIYDIQSASATSAPVLKFNIYAHDNCLNGVYFNSNGDRLYSGSADGLVKEWDVITGEELSYLSGNVGGVGSIAMNPQGTHLLAASYGGSLNVWEIDKAGNEEWFTLHSFPSIGKLSDDGTLFSVFNEISDSETKWEFWELTPGGLKDAPVREVILPLFRDYDWFMTGDMERLVTLRNDETARVINAEVWDTVTGQLITAFPVYKSALDTGPLCQIYIDCINIGGLRRDGTQITVSSEAGPVTQWDLETGKMIREYPGSQGAWRYQDFSPDGTLLSIAGTNDNIVRVWDTRSGNLVKEFVGHTDGVFFGGFSPDGKRLFTGGRDGTARVWDVQTGQELLTLSQPTTSIFWLYFSQDGKYLATAAFDRAVKLWDANSGEELLTFLGTCVWITPDSKGIITNDLDGIVRGYYLDYNDLLEKARSRLIRTWTQEECSAFLHTNTCPDLP